MMSIRNNLVKSLSISLSLVFALVMLIIDVVLDNWVDKEFEQSLMSKASLLVALVSEDERGVEFEFSGEFMPEFERQNNAEYFQLWIGDEVYEKSDSLDFQLNNSLPFVPLLEGKKKIIETRLPDGRDGLIIYYSFKSQVDTAKRSGFYTHLKEAGVTQPTMLLAYAASTEDTEGILVFLDFLFVLATFIVVFLVVYVVRNKVDLGLIPLNELNNELKKIKISDENLKLSNKNLSLELVPFIDSINSFIDQNKTLYEKEKRLTSDIAHELKTPITELINLTEVVIKFPQDKISKADYPQQVLGISWRLKNVISNLLLLNKLSGNGLPKDDIFDYQQIIHALYAPYESRIILNFQTELPPLENNLFAVETVLKNLINNAIQYSPEESVILLTLESVGELPHVSISNEVSEALSVEDLENMFEPMWQKDISRSSSENFGLGLAIVASLCDAIDADIKVTLTQKTITFDVLFN